MQLAAFARQFRRAALPGRPFHFCGAGILPTQFLNAYFTDFFVNAVRLRMPAARAASTIATTVP
jgi:hypothetical protein